MNNQITISDMLEQTNTQNRRQKALKTLVQLKKRVEKLEKKLFFTPKENQQYYYVDTDFNCVSSDSGDSLRERHCEAHNVFQTKELAEKALEKIKRVLYESEHCEH